MIRHVTRATRGEHGTQPIELSRKRALAVGSSGALHQVVFGLVTRHFTSLAKAADAQIASIRRQGFLLEASSHGVDARKAARALVLSLLSSHFALVERTSELGLQEQ